jgi:N-acetylmuramoyl-L-alanine amidase
MFAFDAGHGVEKDMRNGSRAIDPGCESSDHRFQEANITLHYANAAARSMNERGGDVLVTRTEGNTAYAREGFDFRLAAANNAFAGYVSFHVNHAEHGAAHGTRLYVDRRASELSWSTQLLNVFRPNARSETNRANHRVDPSYNVEDRWDYIHDTETRRPGFQMINGSRIPRTPTALLEVGFISNPIDAQNILSRDHIGRVTNELVSELWNFNEIRATMLRSQGVQSMIRQNPGMADLVREISGQGNPHHNSIMFADTPNVPNHRAQTTQR